MNAAALLLGLISFSGLISISGGLWLMAKQQVIVDEVGNPTEIELPFFGKLTTNAPAVVAIFLGAALSLAPLTQIEFQPEIPLIDLNATVRMDGVPSRNMVFVGAIPNRYLKTANNLSGGEGRVSMKVDEPGSYNVIVFTATEVRDNRPIFDLIYGPAELDTENNYLKFEGEFVAAISGEESTK